MRVLDTLKFTTVTPPAAIVDNAAFTTAAIDTQGWGELMFLVILGALDIAVAVLKVTESEDSGMSGATDVPSADFSVSPATLPAATADNLLFGVIVSVRGKRKRYLDISFTGGDGSAGSYAAVIAIQAQPETYPIDAAGRGFSQLLRA